MDREVDLQGVNLFALWKCVWKGQQHMDLACPRHGCGSLGTFRACSKCRRREEEFGASDCSALCGDGSELPSVSRSSRGSSPDLVFITAEVSSRPCTISLPCLMGHSRAGRFS